MARDEKINKETKTKTLKGRYQNNSHNVFNFSCVRLTQSKKQSSTACNFQKIHLKPINLERLRVKTWARISKENNRKEKSSHINSKEFKGEKQ